MENNGKIFGRIVIVLIFALIIFFAGIQYASQTTSSPDISNNTDEDDKFKVQIGDEIDDIDLLNILANNNNNNGVLSIRDTDATKGNGPILLIEYSDYECPFCKRFHPTAQQLVDEGEITWIYRHLPLPSHRTASTGSIIGECIKENKGVSAFWQYTDSIFLEPRGTVELYGTLARSIGLTQEEVDACLANGSKATEIVKSHLADARLYGINGTPGAFVVNTRTGDFQRIPGALPLESVRKLIDTIR